MMYPGRHMKNSGEHEADNHRIVAEEVLQFQKERYNQQVAHFSVSYDVKNLNRAQETVDHLTAIFHQLLSSNKIQE
jgi:hypothetical protein